MWDLPFNNDHKAFLQRLQAAVNLYAGGVLFIKLSLFLLYLQLFRPNRATRWLIVVGAVVNALFYPVCIILNCAFCVPAPLGENDDATWLRLWARCGPLQNRIAFAQGVFGTVSDVYLLLLPIQMVMRLNLPLQRKLGVSAVFLSGIM